MQRKAKALGKGLGKTTGWIHRAALKMKNVDMIGGVNYEKIDDVGLHISFGEGRENPRVIECDNVILCAGQISERSLADALIAKGVACHVIGGADVAAELDAKRAIDQAFVWAPRSENMGRLGCHCSGRVSLTRPGRYQTERVSPPSIRRF